MNSLAILYRNLFPKDQRYNPSNVSLCDPILVSILSKTKTITLLPKHMYITPTIQRLMLHRIIRDRPKKLLLVSIKNNDLQITKLLAGLITDKNQYRTCFTDACKRGMTEHLIAIYDANVDEFVPHARDMTKLLNISLQEKRLIMYEKLLDIVIKHVIPAKLHRPILMLCELREINLLNKTIDYWISISFNKGENDFLIEKVEHSWDKFNTYLYHIIKTGDINLACKMVYLNPNMRVTESEIYAVINSENLLMVEYFKSCHISRRWYNHYEALRYAYELGSLNRPLKIR